MSRQPVALSLFWRTFFYLAILLTGGIVAWVQTLRALEFEPRALQTAQQIAGLVGLSRSALQQADNIHRVTLMKSLGNDAVRVAPQERTDRYEPFEVDRFSQRVGQELRTSLGPGTVIARSVNGEPGLWVGFTIDDEGYWLQAESAQAGQMAGYTWFVWIGIALLATALGSVGIARLINRPLKKLSFAASRVREGDFNASQLNEAVATSEIREVNIGFNRMAQRLSKIEQDRALMLAGISHDLRTPLARLRLETEMSVDDAQAREHMAADIDQVNAIIDKFLDYARPDHLKPERVSLNQVVDAAIFSVGQDPNTYITTNIPRDTAVMGDAVELQRVFSNLIENAIKYNVDGGEVFVSTHHVDNTLRISVRDTGIGIPEESLPRIFERFYRVDKDRSRAVGGTGLGLAIVKHILEAHHAPIAVESKPGQGTEISFVLEG